MNNKIISTNAKIMSFMLLAVLTMFMTLSVASAATMDQKSGAWIKKQYKVNGEWSIEKRGDQHVISFDNKFKTKAGPDLKVFLSPQSMTEVTGKTATNGAVLVAKLKSNKNAQEYVLPADLDISQFRSLLIHCEQYSVLWGGGDL